MDDFETARNELEQAIAATEGVDDGPEYPSRRAVLIALATNDVTLVLSEPWDGTSPPDRAPPGMLVSDGPDRTQAMLAVFTSAERAHDFQSGLGVTEHPTTVPGPWAILATPQKAGIMINPNQPLGFRIAPASVATLRGDVATAIERARARGTAQ